MKWANYLKRHSFLAHLLFSLSLSIICLDLQFRLNWTSTQKNYIPGLYNMITSVNSVALAMRVCCVHVGPTRASFTSVQCAAGSVPSKRWHKKCLYALSVWLTIAEFICCLSCVKKNWQFHSDLGWIFKIVTSPYENPTGFVACWKLTAASILNSAPLPWHPGSPQLLAVSCRWSGLYFLFLICLPPTRQQQYSIIENTWGLITCLDPPSTFVV